MKQQQKGKIVIISSPSGGGKTSICQKLLEDNSEWRFSISYTTRTKRESEQNGREYFFVDAEEFESLVLKNKFAEHFRVHLYRYGTPREPLEETLASGGVMLLDVDVKGAQALKKEYPGAITIFIQPPNVEALKSRLTARGTETDEQLQVRFKNAIDEMKSWEEFEYVVINDDLNKAVCEVSSIIWAHSCRTELQDREQMKELLGL